jgi:hypothetical protein
MFSKVNNFFLVLLQAPDSVLIERAAGKRIDPKTGDVYHTTFDFPLESTIQQRLIVSENNTEEDLVNRLIVYHRYIGGVEDSLKANLKQINVDQPKGDVLNQSNFFFIIFILKFNQFKIYDNYRINFDFMAVARSCRDPFCIVFYPKRSRDDHTADIKTKFMLCFFF